MKAEQSDAGRDRNRPEKVNENTDHTVMLKKATAVDDKLTITCTGYNKRIVYVDEATGSDLGNLTVYKAKPNILLNAAMGEKPEVLKYHAELMSPEFPEFFRVHFGDIRAVD